MNPWGLTEAQTRVMDAFIEAGCAKGAARLLDCSIKNIEHQIQHCRKKMTATNRLHFFIQWDRWKRQDDKGNA